MLVQEHKATLKLTAASRAPAAVASHEPLTVAAPQIVTHVQWREGSTEASDTVASGSGRRREEIWRWMRLSAAQARD